MAIKDDVSSIATEELKIVNNKMANFAYDDTAYSQNTADGTDSYNYNSHQNIPLGTAEMLQVNSTVLLKGFRSQASSVTRMFLNHFFGRSSFNLNKVNDHFYELLTKLKNAFGSANGIATLDGNARLPVAQLPVEAVQKINGVSPVSGDVKNVLIKDRTEYNNLPVADKKGKFFLVQNVDTTGQIEIKDNVTATDSTWSSSKINTEIGSKINTALTDYPNNSQTDSKINNALANYDKVEYKSFTANDLQDLFSRIMTYALSLGKNSYTLVGDWYGQAYYSARFTWQAEVATAVITIWGTPYFVYKDAQGQVSFNQMATIADLWTWAGLATQVGVDTGINVNAGQYGRTLEVIWSAQFSDGANTNAGIDLIRCGYDGNFITKTNVVADIPNTNFIPQYTVSDRGTLIISSNSNTVYAKIIANR